MHFQRPITNRLLVIAKYLEDYMTTAVVWCLNAIINHDLKIQNFGQNWRKWVTHYELIWVSLDHYLIMSPFNDSQCCWTCECHFLPYIKIIESIVAMGQKAMAGFRPYSEIIENGRILTLFLANWFSIKKEAYTKILRLVGVCVGEFFY